ncbi:MAG: tRNA (guanosine(37)-N1)-methyltransferase TrmD [Myxococcales bacterium]|nr:tRNA (guanosine(37)-N1)-methyltransferase TrmD [Myxococcales bacterium]
MSDAPAQRFEVLSLFPELFDDFAKVGLMGKACANGLIRIDTKNPRDFTTDRHRSVDDTPYGGGSGMVMRPDPLVAAMEDFDREAAGRGEPRAHRVLLTPQGRVFDQGCALDFAEKPAIMLICGRYEGIDERACALADEQLSLGDFVLNGGEVAALAVIESVSRLIPGVLGNAESLRVESHEAGLLEHPQYTRPRVFRGAEVPAVLLSGDHGAIERWRRQQALLRTRARRPELFASLQLDAGDRALLEGAEQAEEA